MAFPAPIVKVVGFVDVLDSVPAVLDQLLKYRPVPAVAVKLFVAPYSIDPPAVTDPYPLGETAVVNV